MTLAKKLSYHFVVTMDDTVLLATSRENIKKKFEKLMQFCEKYGMVVNEELKTKLMVINGSKKDREQFVMKTVTVKHTTKYIYLGSPFTEDGNVNTVMNIHLASKTSDLNKFKIFCAKNSTMPYRFKK